MLNLDEIETVKTATILKIAFDKLQLDTLAHSTENYIQNNLRQTRLKALDECRHFRRKLNYVKKDKVLCKLKLVLSVCCFVYGSSTTNTVKLS